MRFLFDMFIFLLQQKFWAHEKSKTFGVGKVGEGWKDQRNRFFNERNPMGVTPEHEIAADVPRGVPPDAWARYVKWRVGEVGQARSKRGKAARKSQTIRHTGGSRLFACSFQDMVYICIKVELKLTNLFQLTS